MVMPSEGRRFRYARGVGFVVSWQVTMSLSTVSLRDIQFNSSSLCSGLDLVRMYLQVLISSVFSSQ